MSVPSAIKLNYSCDSMEKQKNNASRNNGAFSISQTNLIVSDWWFFKWWTFQPASASSSCSCFSLHRRRKGLWGHRKHNLTNLNESGLKRSEQRAVCNEGKVMQKISCQKLETSSYWEMWSKLSCWSRPSGTWERHFNLVREVICYI